MTATRGQPIDLEIIRHLLRRSTPTPRKRWAGFRLGDRLGSPANLNTAVMTADGTIVSCSKIRRRAVDPLNLIVKGYRRRYGAIPASTRATSFLPTTHYLGVLHQPDVTIVAPIFDGDRLIAWSGSTVQ